MVEIELLYEGQLIKGFKAQGHAGFKEMGQDIYCAGVSAVTGTALLGLQKHLSCPPFYQSSEGFLECRVPANLGVEDQKTAHLILSTMEAGLNSLQEAYPQYIKVVTGRLRNV